MKRIAPWPLVLLAAVACGQGSGQRGEAALDTARRDLQLAPVDTTARLADVPVPSDTAGAPIAALPADTPRRAEPAPAPAKPKRPATTTTKPATSTSAAAPTSSGGSRSLASGASFATTLRDSIDSKTSKAGDVVSLRTTSDVTDDAGRVVIPAGSSVKARITAIKWSENKGDKGTLTLEPTSVTIGGTSYDINGTTRLPAFAYRKRGGALGDASKVGAGAAAGAVVGGLLGKGTGAAIGGVVGGAVGAQRAVETKDRDVILAPGSAVTVVLSAAFTR
jgi:hypothetical protein